MSNGIRQELRESDGGGRELVEGLGNKEDRRLPGKGMMGEARFCSHLKCSALNQTRGMAVSGSSGLMVKKLMA